jgi:dihydrofolate synthase / folylpolyglutamate synthase
LKAAMGWAQWPARIQRLAKGPLNPDDQSIWIDGCHNEPAAQAVAAHFRAIVEPDTSFHIVVGILANKDAQGLLSHFAGLATHLTALPVNNHAHHAPSDLADLGQRLNMVASTAASFEEALAQQPHMPTLILGSLYLAGEALRANDQMPD